jgi:hypothetical protein
MSGVRTREVMVLLAATAQAALREIKWMVIEWKNFLCIHCGTIIICLGAAKMLAKKM